MSQKKGQQGFSLIELLIVVAIIGIIAAIAIPNLLASRRSANDASAIGTLRTIHSAQATYQSTYGGGTNFALTSAVLASNGLLDSSLAAASAGKSGFNIAVAGTAAVAGGAPSSYLATAVPQQATGVTATGTRDFCVTEDGVVHFRATTGAAPADAAACRALSTLGQ